MSTIASPRPSITLSSASRRGSASTDTTVTSTVTSSTKNVPERGSLRRNRTALRDYYNLVANASSTSLNAPPTPSLETDRESELDKSTFEPDAYVQTLLATEGLEGVLKVEAGLVSEIRSLDGEKKALVYDNYSKLIAATDTIRRMREKMSIPEVGTLSNRIGAVGETAQVLRDQLRKAAGRTGSQQVEDKKSQQETVKWTLAAPARLRYLVEEGERERADQEWEEVDTLLTKWHGVRGVAELRQTCLAALTDTERG